MNKFGLSAERYAQMMKEFDGDESFIEEAVSDWGIEICNRGYAVFDFDGTGMLEVEAIGACGLYDDEEAAYNAARDGIKIIPVQDLPKNFERRYFGWIDTPENREKIKLYCERKNIC